MRDNRPAPCRTREEILAGAVIRKMTDGSTCVFVECHNCGGTGNYPSSMMPPGKCRFYCWQNRDAETYGKLPVEIERYVKRQQSYDRQDWRRANPTPAQLAAAQRQAWLADEAQAYIEHAERERAAQRAAEKAAAPSWSAGRQEVEGMVLKCEWRYAGPSWTRSGAWKATVKLDDGRVLWTSYPHEVRHGDRVRLTVTVEPSPDDRTFAFGKRPANAAVLSEAA